MAGASSLDLLHLVRVQLLLRSCGGTGGCGLFLSPSLLCGSGLLSPGSLGSVTRAVFFVAHARCSSICLAVLSRVRLCGALQVSVPVSPLNHTFLCPILSTVTLVTVPYKKLYCPLVYVHTWSPFSNSCASVPATVLALILLLLFTFRTVICFSSC